MGNGLSDTSESGFNQFLVLENHMMDTKILIIGSIEKS